MNTLTNMNAGELLKLVDAASMKNDRWLFLATLVVLGVFVWYVLRSFMRQHERLIADHKKARNAYQNSLRNLVAEQSLQDCRDELRLCRERGKE